MKLNVNCKLKLTQKLKLMLCIWWVSNNCLVLEICAHCLRETPRATEVASTSSTLHMWQPRYPTGSESDTGSCNRPTTLRLAADSNVATSQLNDNATTQTAASPVVTLANYVYQCAAKRESSPSKPSTISSSSSSSNSIDLGMSINEFQLQPLRHQQQMTVPAIVLQLAKSWEFK
ncbi:uncharacterized protein LOC117791267 [Drosophila innubila]|uniref:uncharacterized protein LOC117791267 n=1 Tax=Drosophila innubila TaxID=198719 RepID=UPI00148CCB9F|nr:uncharacterized protein LOC117791267 [Drosophila innubila]